MLCDDGEVEIEEGCRGSENVFWGMVRKHLTESSTSSSSSSVSV